MHVTFSTAAENMARLADDKKDFMGYSHASYEIMNTFERFGIKTSIAKRDAPIGISMGFPRDYRFYDHQYKIGYTAWESTELKDGWLEKMLMCDELWATSSWTAEVFKKTTGREDIHVYPHGISESWRPVKRNVSETFRFLHVGEPQARKNGQLVVDAFVELFGNDNRYQLILKCSNINTTRIYMPDGSILGSPDSKYKNILIITDEFPHKKMVELFQKTHALIYPTTGEGFGFIPLQALATGMPVATTYEWAEYKNFITVPIESTLSPSEYPMLHPGNVFNVSKDEVKKSMIDLVENYDVHSKKSYKNSFHVHMEYDWMKVTEPTSEKIKNIFKSRGF